MIRRAHDDAVSLYTRIAVAFMIFTVVSLSLAGFAGWSALASLIVGAFAGVIAGVLAQRIRDVVEVVADAIDGDDR